MGIRTKLLNAERLVLGDNAFKLLFNMGEVGLVHQQAQLQGCRVSVMRLSVGFKVSVHATLSQCQPLSIHVCSC